MASLTAMLTNSLTQSGGLNKKLMLTLHASIGYSMNDRNEGKLFLDKFLTDSELKKSYRSMIEGIINSEGNFYVTSLCKSDVKSRDNGSIPMWSMYGNGGEGAIIVFDYKCLKTYIEKNGIGLFECKYVNSSDLKSRLKSANAEMKSVTDNSLNVKLCNLVRDSYLMKDWHWEYENEYRLVVQSSACSFKCGKYGLTAYKEVPIPLSCVKAIILGPLVIQDVAEENLSLILRKINSIDNTCNIKVKKSTINMR